jgi:S-adenosylmethionine:tRNA ribosyltransferase-isomerase
LNLDELDYELPPDRIAQVPLAERDASRLLVLGRRSGSIRHRRFGDLPEELRAGDLLVLNDTRVRPARLRGTKETGGRVAMLLLEPEESPGLWRCLLDVSRPPSPGSRLRFAGGLTARVEGRAGETWVVRLETATGADPLDVVEACGEVPLPPYIARVPGDPRLRADRERYQTVYARETGSAAAPTAGLHFTPALFEALERMGVGRAEVTLHVGIGTFLPLREETLREGRLHAESFSIPEEAARAVARVRRGRGRVVAVGTTTVRALESACREDGSIEPGSGRTELFIRPGHRFRAVDALITNFHLPRSSLLSLVFAFAGRESVLAAYREAVRQGYRFYSYGDSMLVCDP